MRDPEPKGIFSPKHPRGHPDRSRTCEFAVGPVLDALIVASLAAGWTEEDVISALLGITWSKAIAMLRNRSVTVDIELADRILAAMGRGSRS